MSAVKKQTIGWGFETKTGALVNEVFPSKKVATEYSTQSGYSSVYKIVKVQVSKYKKK